MVARAFARTHEALLRYVFIAYGQGSRLRWRFHGFFLILLMCFQTNWSFIKVKGKIFATSVLEVISVFCFSVNTLSAVGELYFLAFKVYSELQQKSSLFLYANILRCGLIYILFDTTWSAHTYSIEISTRWFKGFRPWNVTVQGQSYKSNHPSVG